MGEEIMTELVLGLLPLCKHKPGNIVVQRALEFGSFDQRRRLIERLSLDALCLAKGSVSNHVIVCALGTCTLQEAQPLVAALTSDPCAWRSLGQHGYGSHVHRQLQRLVRRGSPPADEGSEIPPTNCGSTDCCGAE